MVIKVIKLFRFRQHIKKDPTFTCKAFKQLKKFYIHMQNLQTNDGGNIIIRAPPQINIFIFL
ncbi:MAG: hypothetical protein EGR30_05190 [Prevotella copri]|nr:hypothetical protein [Segatella copri]